MSDADHARVPIAPPLLFLGFLILALVLDRAAPLRVEDWGGLAAMGVLVVAVGLVLGFTALASMRRAHTSPYPAKPSTALVTTGIYGLSRNPIYLGYTFIVLGFSLLARTWWGLILTPVCVLVATRVLIRAEEIYLLGRFGEQYRGYAARVRRWI